MKWYLLTLVMYTSLWGFLGWGIQGSVVSVIVTLSIYLTSLLITIFHWKRALVKESLCVLWAPSMTVYAIIKHLDTMSTWRIVFIILAIIIQVALFSAYFYFKAKKNSCSE